MLAVVHGRSASLGHYVGFEGSHSGVVRLQLAASDGVVDAPVYHVSQHRDSAELNLELRICFRVRIRGVRMAHVARDCYFTSQKVGTVEYTRAIENELLRFTAPNDEVLFGVSAICVPFGLIAELADRHPGLGILHVDAHADLRKAYEGFSWSHAGIMGNVLDRLSDVSKIVQLGIRDFGESELARIEEPGSRLRTWFDADVKRDLAAGGSWDRIARDAIQQLPETVHVSLDIDGLDPGLCPHTGTPVPGGLAWAELCHLLVLLAESGKTVVGFDLVEVAPGPRGSEWDANVGARALYKLIGCALRTRASR